MRNLKKGTKIRIVRDTAGEIHYGMNRYEGQLAIILLDDPYEDDDYIIRVIGNVNAEYFLHCSNAQELYETNAEAKTLLRSSKGGRTK